MRAGAAFTLVEALVAITVFAVILIVLLAIYDNNQKTYVRAEASAELQQNLRVAIANIARDARLAGYDPSNAIAAQAVTQPFQPVSGTALSVAELRVVGDVDQDGVTDCVAFRLSGGQLLRRQTAWSSGACGWTATEGVIAEGFTGLTFTYYQANGATTTDPAQAKRVRAVVLGTNTAQGLSFRAENDITLRQ